MKCGYRTHKSASCLVKIPDGVPFSVRRKTREIHDLKTHDEDNGKGMASELMRSISSDADNSKMALILTLKNKRLASFYERFGFAMIQTSPIYLMLRQAQ